MYNAIDVDVNESEKPSTVPKIKYRIAERVGWRRSESQDHMELVEGGVSGNGQGRFRF